MLRSSSVTAGHGRLAGLAAMVGQAQRNAQLLDPEGGFPADDVARLRKAGWLAAVLPQRLGGAGIGTDPAQAAVTGAILHTLGRASIALARLYEGHLNAVRLILLLADDDQRQAAAADIRSGHLHALWVTDAPAPLRYTITAAGIELSGGKRPCSAAGHATRAVVTSLDPQGATRLLRLPLGCGETVDSLGCPLQGVRGAVTGEVDFTGVRHAGTAVFGRPDDYLREPEFSTGAWRAAAIAAGALTALVAAAGAELQARGRAAVPQQAERLARMLIHAQAATLWMHHVAPLAETADRSPAAAIASVQLARSAIEAAGLDTIQLVQRSLGLSALMRSNPVERMCRDLATYLRQPAADEALTDAAAYFVAHLPGADAC